MSSLYRKEVLVVVAIIFYILKLSKLVDGIRHPRSGETGNNNFLSNKRQNTSYTVIAKKLREMIKSSNGYDKWVRPNDTGAPVEVLVEMKIMSFGKVREDEMDFTLDIFFRQWWTDHRLAHGVKKTFNVAANPAEFFWTPDTYFVNVKSSSFHHVTRENTRLMIKPDGKIYYSTRVTLTAQCKMEFSMFPMDTQVCLLKIESYAYTIEDVRYYWNVRGQDTSIEIYADEMAQFDMKEVYTTKLKSSNSKGSFDSLRVYFKFKRRASFFFLQHYIPSSFIVFISFLSFWINKNAVPARISLTVTCVLSIMVLFESINSSLPRISYLKAIDYYLITSFFFILASMVEYCFVLNVVEKNSEASRKNSLQSNSFNITDVMDMENQTKPIDRYSNTSTTSRTRRDVKQANGYANNSTVVNIPLMTRMDSARMNFQFGEMLPAGADDHVHLIDRYSRRLFPLLYLLFNIGYWSYFLPKVD